MAMPIFVAQKATGHFFAALVGVPKDALRWTRGMPATFNRSDQVEEGTTEQTMPGIAEAIAASNRQHTDHDTESWPRGV